MTRHTLSDPTDPEWPAFVAHKALAAPAAVFTPTLYFVGVAYRFASGEPIAKRRFHLARYLGLVGAESASAAADRALRDFADLEDFADWARPSACNERRLLVVPIADATHWPASGDRLEPADRPDAFGVPVACLLGAW